MYGYVPTWTFLKQSWRYSLNVCWDALNDSTALDDWQPNGKLLATVYDSLPKWKASTVKLIIDHQLSARLKPASSFRQIRYYWLAKKKCTHQIIQIRAHKTSDKNVITYDQWKIDV